MNKLPTRILIVDDDPVFQMIAVKLIERAELYANLFCFSSGKECLDFLFRNRPTPEKCLILLDINMPIMGGWEFLDMISEQEEFNDHRIVMVTSSTNETDYDKSSAYPQVKGYLTKPLDLEHVRWLGRNFVID